MYSAGTVMVLVVVLVIVYRSANRETKVLTADVRKQRGGTYVTLTHGVTHYELAGPSEGKLVVLVHGVSIPLWTWDPHMSVLTGAGLRVLRYDMYGRGYSDRPDVCYDRMLMVDQLRDLLDALNVSEPVALVGSSLGAAIAVAFAATYPERVGKRIALISPLLNSGNVPHKIFRPPILGEFLFRTIGMSFFTKRARAFYHGHPRADEYVQRYLEQISYKGFERSGLSAIRSDMGTDYTPAYQAVGRQKRECLLIWGSEDKEFTREKIDAIQKLLGSIDLQVIKGVGHGVALHLRSEVDKLLAAFLTQETNQVLPESYNTTEGNDPI